MNQSDCTEGWPVSSSMMDTPVLLSSNYNLSDALESLRSSGDHTDTRLVGESGQAVEAHWALLARHPWWRQLMEGEGDWIGGGVVVLLPGRSQEEVEEWVREAYRGETNLKQKTVVAEKHEVILDFKEEVQDYEDIKDQRYDNVGNFSDTEEYKIEGSQEAVSFQQKNFEEIFESTEFSDAFGKTVQKKISEGEYNVQNIAKTCFQLISGCKMLDRTSLENFVVEDKQLIQIVRNKCRRKGETNFNCKQCDFTATLRNAMEKHVMEHLGKLPFMCDLCQESFGRRSNAVKHIRVRHIFRELKVYVRKQIPVQRDCHICGVKLASRQSYHGHMMRLHNEEVSNCKFCDFSSLNYRDIVSHQRMVHGTESRSCHICGSHFKSQSGFDHHMKNSHGDSIYSCKECGKEYKTKKSLDFHFKCNHLPKTHICEECGAKFSTETLLGSHKLSHLTDPNEFEHSCSICPRKFKTKRHLLGHIRTHSEAKPFSCGDCEMAFKAKTALRRHKSVVHEGIRPYACRLCSFKAGQSHSLTVHYRGVHGLEKDDIEKKQLGPEDNYISQA